MKTTFEMRPPIRFDSSPRPAVNGNSGFTGLPPRPAPGGTPGIQGSHGPGSGLVHEVANHSTHQLQRILQKLAPGVSVPRGGSAVDRMLAVGDALNAAYVKNPAGFSAKLNQLPGAGLQLSRIGKALGKLLPYLPPETAKRVDNLRMQCSMYYRSGDGPKPPLVPPVSACGSRDSYYEEP